MKVGRPKSEKPTLRQMEKESAVSIKTIQKYLLGDILHMHYFTVNKLNKYFKHK